MTMTKQNKEQLVSTMRMGKPVTCLRGDYPEVRKLLSDIAAKWIWLGMHNHAMLALEEIDRLDEKFKTEVE